MSQANIYNTSTGQAGYQVPGAALVPGWAWGTAPAPKTTLPVAPTPSGTSIQFGTQQNPYGGAAYNASLNTTPQPISNNQATNPSTINPTVGNGHVDVNGNYVPSTGAATYANGNSTPAIPTNTNSPASASVASDPTSTSNDMLKTVLGLMTPTSQETGLQNQLAGLEANRTTLQRGIESQPIATSFMGGQETELNKNINAEEGAISPQLSALQSQRGSALSAATAALDYQKPVSLGLGANLVNPLTGETVATGQSYSAKQDAANVLSLSKLYPDAGILPSDTPDVAAAKASQAQSFIAKYGKVQVQWDPASGTFVTNSSNRLGSTLPGRNYPTNSNTTNSGTNFGVASGGGSLQSGSSGSSVQALQNFLVSQGYLSPSDMATGPGIYGPHTAAAVAAFQQANGINTAGGSSGVFGPQTQSAARSLGFGGGNPQVNNTNTATDTSSTSATPFGLNLGSKIDSATLSYIQTGDMPSGIYPNDQDAVRARAQAVIPGFNPSIAKANAHAIGEQTSQQADTARGITAADSNFQLLTDSFKGKVNNYAQPLANQFANWVSTGVFGSSDVVNFKSAVSTLQTEYATVLGRGGEVTDSVRKSAQNVINGNYSMNDLISLHDYIDKEGKNVINSYTQTIKDLSTGGIGSGGTGSSSASANSNSNNPLGI